MIRDWPAVATWLVVVCSAARLVGADTVDAQGDLRFVRVNVPAGVLADLPLGPGRYVPMPMAEFEEAVARLGPAGGSVRTTPATASRYDLTLDAAGKLTGTVEFSLGQMPAGMSGQMPLGRVEAGRCTIQTAAGTGEAAVFCAPDGSVAVRTPGPGTYGCDVRLPGTPLDTASRLPLVPSLATTVDLRLPEGMRPNVVGAASAAVAIESLSGAASRWRLSIGPTTAGGGIGLWIDGGRRAPPRVRAWNRIEVEGRQAEVVARLEPMAVWTSGPLELAVSPDLLVTSVVADDLAGQIPRLLEQGRLTLLVPASLGGSSRGLVVSGVMPVTPGRLGPLPVIEPGAARWGGCTARLVLDPVLAVRRISLEHCRPVSPTLTEAWPMPAGRPAAAGNGIEPARIDLEYESPGGRVQVSYGPRDATLDVARVSSVDISPGTVLCKTAVEVRVVAGQAFVLVADVAPGWIIDSVEAVGWSGGREALPVDPAERSLEWRVARSPRGSELRIGLPVAATPRRDLGLRITGHRSGLPLGSEFSSDEMDMVRFPGEAAVLEFQLGPTAVLEPVGGEFGVEPVPERLEQLVSAQPPRARIRAGERAAVARARVVRRRPPVEAEVNVDVVARGDRLAETFTFTCRPVAGELDAAVIHFSQPMGGGLEWSSGEGTTLAAQLMESGDATRGELRSEAAVAESWLVELRPATAAAVTFRAFRTVPLEMETAVPLAWVEAAERPGGTVTVRGEPGRRPVLFNRQLRELPAVAGADPTVVELAYGSPRSLTAAPAAEVAPPAATAVPRAWAWQQRTVVWCHESGGLEWETAFDIENEGRDTATVTLPGGVRVEGVSVGGEVVTAAPIGPDASGLTVPLTRGTGRIRLVVRGVAERDVRLGWWRIGDVACGIDMPVLDAEAILMLPPGLELVSGLSAAADGDWAARLFGVATAWGEGNRTTRGFRSLTLAAASTRAAGPVVFRRDAATSLAVVLGAAAVVVLWSVARRSVPAAIAGCGVAALAALWCGGPCDALARAVLWGGIAGTWAGAGQRPVRIVGPAWAVVLGALMASPVGAAEADPVRVYVTPGDEGGTALVPERLFRRLSEAAAAAGPPAVRVLTSDVTADLETGLWRVTLELDADRGGVLLLDQVATDATWWLPSVARELTVTVEREGRALRVTAPAAGRYGIELEVRPAVKRTGALDVAEVALPPAPRATLRLAEAAAGGVWQCDRAAAEGPWLPARPAGRGFDVASAARVRLVRAADPRDSFAGSRAATSVNELTWQEDGCRLQATFEVGAENTIVRSLGLRADPALEPLPGDDDVALVPLGAGRHLIELREARAGQRRVTIGFRLPLADPVGVFEAPSAWLTDVETDFRTVRLRMAAGLDASPELPAGITLVRPRDEEGAAVAVWRWEVTAPAGGGSAASEPRPRIDVRRRSRSAVAVQDLAVDLADDHVGLRLRARFDAGQEPLLEIPLLVPPAAIIERVSLTREPEGDDTDGPQRADVVWSREAADRIVAVAQRPDRGRFRLQLDARLPIRPASRGPLPIARVAADDMPLDVTCRGPEGMVVQLDRPGDVLGEEFELSPGGPAPSYTITRTPSVDGQESVGDAGPLGDGGDGPATPLATTVDLVIDGRGRAWGLARFDFIADDPVVRLVLPAGMRLFAVRADGRELSAEPVEPQIWQLRLHDAGWPRSLVAVIAGSLGGRFEDGSAIRIEPPRLAGLPAEQVLWSLDTPAGFAVRVSAPAVVLDPVEFAARRETEQGAFGEAFARALRRSERPGWENFAPLAAQRRAAGPEIALAGWENRDRQRSERTFLVAGGDGGVTIRGARTVGLPDSIRGAATAAILVLVLAGWTVARRAAALAGLADGLRRWWWLACGLVWLLAQRPPLPGLLMILAGAWIASTWSGVRPQPPTDDAVSASGSRSTLTFAPD